MTFFHDRSALIQTEAPRHVYRQVADDLASAIRSGVLEPNSRLPSEPQLARDVYSVARVTVRKAIKLLVDDGLVVIVRGRGTYVVPGTPSRPPPRDGNGNGPAEGHPPKRPPQRRSQPRGDK